MSLLDKFRRKRTDDVEDDAALVRRAEEDFEQLDAKELRRLKALYEAQEARGRAELVSLQRQDARYSIRHAHREVLIEQYLEEIEALNLKTPGGLRSISAEHGEDPELVAEAWRIFCARRRGGGSRFG